MKRTMCGVVAVAVAFVAGFALRGAVPGEPVAHAQTAGKIYELRTYTVPEDRLGPLNTRFRNHTMRLFEKHGIANVAYFTPQDAPKSATTLVYLIAHPSREAAKQNWSAFGKDPEWQAVAKESGVGRVTVESTFLTATDYSPMK